MELDRAASIEEVDWRRDIVKRVGLSAKCQFGDIIELMHNGWKGRDYVSGQRAATRRPERLGLGLLFLTFAMELGS